MPDPNPMIIQIEVVAFADEGDELTFAKTTINIRLSQNLALLTIRPR